MSDDPYAWIVPLLLGTAEGVEVDPIVAELDDHGDLRITVTARVRGTVGAVNVAVGFASPEDVKPRES
jgi:hypothetical protein